MRLERESGEDGRGVGRRARMRWLANGVDHGQKADFRRRSPAPHPPSRRVLLLPARLLPAVPRDGRRAGGHRGARDRAGGDHHHLPRRGGGRDARGERRAAEGREARHHHPPRRRAEPPRLRRPRLLVRPGPVCLGMGPSFLVVGVGLPDRRPSRR